MLLVGTYGDKLKTPIGKNMCTRLFIAALVTVAKTWKQPKRPRIDKWMKEKCYIYNGILRSHEK